jgi:protein arginine kinase activator
MNCQKCGKHAIVHLTEMVSDQNGQKQTIEIHLCLAHASEMGIITPTADTTKPLSLHQVYDPQHTLKPLAIVPKEEHEMGLALTRPQGAQGDQPGCPVCGMTWQAFKQYGVLGCAQCYDIFEAKLAPLIKRAQENFGQHAGKVPPRISASDPARQVTTARLRRELDQALTQENYEAAAKLRDELRTMGQN